MVVHSKDIDYINKKRNYMQRINIPYLAESKTQLGIFSFNPTKEKGASINIDKNNWKEQFPYTPNVTARLSYDEKGIVVYFNVEAKGLRTLSAGDGHYVHEDSCVEFFMQKERGSAYINIEFNARGVCYASHHSSPKDSIPFTSDEYRQIERYATVSEEGLDSSGFYNWNLVFRAPWTLLGYKDGEIPSRLYANLYKCGDKTSNPHFLSWNEITNYDNPTFHCPENFAEIHLLER